MLDIELFEEFKTYCKDYRIEFDNLILENKYNMFILFQPQGKEEIIYEVRRGNSRLSGSSDDIEELLEYAEEVVPDLITVKEKRKYI